MLKNAITSVFTLHRPFNLDLILLGLVFKIRVLAYLTLILNPKPKLLRLIC